MVYRFDHCKYRAFIAWPTLYARHFEVVLYATDMQNVILRYWLPGIPVNNRERHQSKIYIHI